MAAWAVARRVATLFTILLLPFAALALTVEVRGPGDRPLPGAVVFLESAQAKSRVKPLEGAEMSQVSRQFVPEVLVVPVGTAIDFPNRDKVRHHVYSFSPAKKFELKLYIGTPTNPVVFDQPGVVVLGCNIHDQMVGWVLVVETPYYAQTGADGRATLNAPPGNYQLRVWHLGLPTGAPALSLPVTAKAWEQNVVVSLSGIQP